MTAGKREGERTCTTEQGSLASRLAAQEQGVVALIDLLEKATGPDRELDALIWAEMDDRDTRVAFLDHWAAKGILAKSRKVPHDECVVGIFEGLRFMTVGQPNPPPAYTASIDAALTLVPHFISFELTCSAASTFTRARLWDWRRSPPMSDPDNEWKSEGNRPLAISICIAALKARMGTGG